jgi:signal transduction histidine kinase
LPVDSRDAAVLKDVIARIDGLNALMTDVLLFARPPQLHPAALDVTALLSDTASLLKKDPVFNTVRVEVDGSAPPFMADPELLKVVFTNLLVNGAQAMQGQGLIHVSVKSQEGMCCIALRDTGPGIPPDIRERIFSPFFTSKPGGSGLGLPTAKRLIEAHYGAIAIECPPSGGTTVIVQLPLASQHVDAATSSPQSSILPTT